MHTKTAITLVEMIVVVSILSVLGTIGLISYSSNLPKVRDSARVAALEQINTGLQTYKLKGALPIPDDSIEIKGSGAVIGYQGSIGKNNLKSIGYNKAGFDPDTENFYDYYVTKNGGFFQLMTFLEKQKIEKQFEDISILSKTNALENIYESRFVRVYGDRLGVLTDSDNMPVNRMALGINQGYIDLLLTTDDYTAHFSNDDREVGNKHLYGKMKTLAQSQRFGSPKKCPNGFIPVDGNIELGQPGFCVAKYEMSIVDGSGVPDSSENGSTWNTYKYNINQVATVTRDYPVADISTPEALAACKKIGTHLITNLEWMTLAEDIAQQIENWSGGALGTGFIYTGNSDDPIDRACDKEDGPRPNGAIAGGPDTLDLNSVRSTCDDKRQLLLGNGEIIWDLAGGVGEIVNKTNDITTTIGTNGIYNNYISNTNWYDWTDTDVGFITKGLYGPSGDYSSVQGFGKVRAGGNNDRAFVRGGRLFDDLNAGIFNLDGVRNINYREKNTGFRCAK